MHYQQVQVDHQKVVIVLIECVELHYFASTVLVPSVPVNCLMRTLAENDMF